MLNYIHVLILTRQRLLRSTDSVAVQDRHEAIHLGVAPSGQRNGWSKTFLDELIPSSAMLQSAI